ncbi:hypothetical protein N7478_011449 [Penicillium angulare]|uniref:uncharacterized protein n=1 Tax=Penicillium angulare TaxID=116970 RepID=UPI00253FB3C3|nr:uncharacterized protein N7478_011449 [Penicillium angulare]KAJ5263844.1 hypothetical protein N7478_011449 [Penicillium angulare]
MVAPKYQSNRSGQQSAFPNDFTSKSTLENDRRKREAIAAANLRESQAAEKLERERREREEAAALRIQTLEGNVQNATSQIKLLEGQKLEAEHSRDEWMGKFKAQGEDLNTRLQALNRDMEQQRNQKDAQINELREQRSSIDHKILDELQNDDVQILSITYGSRVYYDSGTSDYKDLLSKFKGAARNGGSFRVCNELIGDDPNGGHSKSLIIVYRYLRPGVNRRLRTLTGWEGNDTRFDPWN